jgi:hypothetical protein
VLAVLSRRSIQGLVDESTRFLKPDQIRHLVGRLNSPSKKYLADVLVAEWELIFLSGLAAVGAVEHESGPEGQRRLDVGLKLRLESRLRPMFGWCRTRTRSRKTQRACSTRNC